MTAAQFTTDAVAWIGAAGIVFGAMTGVIITAIKHTRDIQAAWDAIRVLQRQAANAERKP